MPFLHRSLTQIWSLFTHNILQWVMYSRNIEQRCHMTQEKKTKTKDTEPFLCHYIKIVLLQKYKLGLLIRELRSESTQEYAAKVR